MIDSPEHPSIHTFDLNIVSWVTHEKQLMLVREAVFVREQKIPASVEIDGWDPCSLHVLVTLTAPTHDPVGCGRLLPDGHIGRLAVCRSWRGKGIGRMVLEMLLHLARQEGHKEALLSAQMQALAFYEKLGFKAYGAVYDDVGIPHRDMRAKLQD